jgi:hypothetical protein
MLEFTGIRRKSSKWRKVRRVKLRKGILMRIGGRSCWEREMSLRITSNKTNKESMNSKNK